jgi:hypothetical protein
MFDVHPISALPDDADMDDWVVSGDWAVSKVIIAQYIDDKGSFVMDSFLASNQDLVITEVGTFAAAIFAGMCKVKAERNEANKPSNFMSPPVYPIQVVQLRPGDFIRKVLNTYKSHVSKFWTEAKVEEIEKEHAMLWGHYRKDVCVKSQIDGTMPSSSFNEAWDKLGSYKTLRAFCGGLATAFPNSTSVESDFSILKWELNANRTALMHLSLEGIFQAKQRHVLQGLGP